MEDKTPMLAIVRTAQNIKADVLIVGGAYAGLSTLVALKNHLKERHERKVSVAMVEPKAGLLNILGIPRAIVDPDFAKTQFVPFEKLDDLSLDRLISSDSYVQNHLGASLSPGLRDYLDITYVQGKVLQVEENSAQYTLNDSGQSAKIDFSYCVLAAGRNRPWPTSPEAPNFDAYLKEMAEFNSQVRQCKTVGVVGAGAVGIEIAGDIKHKYPEIDVHLFHPHATFPAEPLTEKFKLTVRESLERSGVKVHTGVRVKEEEPGQLLLPSGERVSVDFTYWCTGFRNNTEILGGPLAQFVSEKNNVHVNEYLQLQRPGGDSVANVFCIGDMVEMPIIKLAGWALYMGRQVANNLVGAMFEGRLVEPFPDLSQMPRGMVIVAGNGEIVSELTGEVELNHPGYVEEYKDYCVGKIRATLGA